MQEAQDGSAPSQPAEAASRVEPAPVEFIEVWRPGRRDDHPRKPRHDSAPRHRRPQRQRQTPPAAATSDATAAAVPADGMPPAVADAVAASTGADERRDGGRHRERPGGGDRNGRTERPSVSRGRTGVPSVARAPIGRVGADHERGQRGGGRPPHGDRPDRDPTLRAKYIKGRGESRDRRDREPDPNSPFAKLAALKEQLEANTKEPR